MPSHSDQYGAQDVMLQAPESQVADATLAAAVQLLPQVPQLLGSLSVSTCMRQRCSNNSNALLLAINSTTESMLML
jgi:hypothetical protein